MKNLYIIPIYCFVLLTYCSEKAVNKETSISGNPVLQGWYADPEGAILGSKYWIFPTYSAKYDEQVFLDAFSSKDLVNWMKHPHILDTSIVKWAYRAIWAPSIIEKQGQYYLFFSANDIQRPGGPLWDENDNRNHTPQNQGDCR